MQTIYQNLLRQINVLSAKFSNMPMDALFRAYDRAMDNNPWIQNKRVKQINTLPVEYSKDAIGEAIKNPGGNEALLRGTHHALEATAYPMLKIIRPRHSPTKMMPKRLSSGVKLPCWRSSTTNWTQKPTPTKLPGKQSKRAKCFTTSDTM